MRVMRMDACGLHPGPAMPASAMSLPSMAQSPDVHGGRGDTHLVWLLQAHRAPHQREGLLSETMMTA
jgi:hypothetical protein